MARRHVALFEFPVLPGVAPLASGYLEAVAGLAEGVRDKHDFTKHVFSLAKDGIMEAVLDVEAHVYGFSCYVWNSKLVRRILPELFARHPTAHVILGGPQVMHKAESYLDPTRENLVLCNGEGEFTFVQYLEQLIAESPDMSKVKGLSFYRNGELVTTEKQTRIRDLNEIPSPYLEGYVDPSHYNLAVFETNRGCPFRCTYCYWGGHTNAKVHKFSANRVFDEITWLCENRFTFILFADANFGILERDVDIARHLAECKRKTGFPMSVLLNSSKNTPGRVTEIIKILSDVGLIAAQPVSMQTMSPVALKAVDRDNIKATSYIELQQTLNSNGLQSFIEMIWPLPGETLDSFKAGIDQLCRLGADSFVMYPLMLINNVEMAQQRDEYRLTTLADPDPFSEAEIVVATRDVSNADYQKGLNLSYHVANLYSFKALRHTMKYLDAMDIMSFTDVAHEFSEHARSVKGNPYTAYIDSIVASMDYHSGAGGFGALGGAVHIALHGEADAFDGMLFSFMARRGWLSDEKIRLRFEIDLLNRPLPYSNTLVRDKSDKLKLLHIEAIDADCITIGATAEHLHDILSILPHDRVLDRECRSLRSRLKIHYRTADQIPFHSQRKLDIYHYHCQYKTRGEIRSIEPIWKVVVPVHEPVLLVT